jgi:hypothetical protein
MRQTGTSLTAAGLALLLLAGLGLIHLRAQQSVVEDDGGDLGVPHAECSFLGKERDQFLTIGLGADLSAMTKSSELTTAVAAALSSGPRLSRGRVSSSPLAGSAIDTAIFAGLQSQGIAAAGLSTDAEFLRRVTLDLTGRIPTAQEVIDFLNDAAPGKRERAIDRLLATPQWADRWAMFFGDLYRNTTVTAQVNRYPDGRDAFHLFLKNSLLENEPYDQMAREMLTASGVNDGRYYPEEFASYQQYLDLTGDYQGNPVKPTAASYIVGGRVTGGPIHDTYDGMAVNVARDFLGLSHMDCIMCHDGKGHLDSLSVWGAQATRLQAWQLAAFFSQTGLSRPRRTPPRPDGGAGVVPRWWIVGPNPRNQPYRLNTTTGNRPSRQPSDAGGLQVVDPVYPFGGGSPSGGESYREALARSLTADPQFARAIVNYIWKAFFSRGLVEPVDQFDLGRIDPSNPPPQPWEIQSPHAGLLNKLAQSFAAKGFDLKWLMREIARAQAYQFSSQYDGAWNPAYEAYFARHQVRRLSAEEIHDALVLSTGVFEPYVVSPTIGVVAFAMQFPDVESVPRAGGRNTPSGAAVSLLDAFLRGNREETARSGEATILQALQLMNSSLVLNRVDSGKPNPALAAILQQPDNTAIQFLYLTVLSRPPSQAELTAGVQLLAGGNRTQKIEDLMWGLYNKVDFIFNY